eukprot:3405613-Pleurochrysis_carterae.AAC.2
MLHGPRDAHECCGNEQNDAFASPRCACLYALLNLRGSKGWQVARRRQSERPACAHRTVRGCCGAAAPRRSRGADDDDFADK